MTEAEWLFCSDPAAMLRFLREKASDRKARLFACACCRRIWLWLTDDRSKKAVEAMEFCLDSTMGSQGRAALHGMVAEAKEAVFHEVHANGHDLFHPTVHAADAVHALTFFSAGWAAAIGTALNCARTVGAGVEDEAEAGVLEQAEKAAQAQILRDVFGNPFRPVSIGCTWLTWNHGSVTYLAESIHQDQAFDRLPILADALEEAGCTDFDILAHCRASGPHVRGCWIVDLLLRKA